MEEFLDSISIGDLFEGKVYEARREVGT